jgi:tripartite-type tricarboxylate transporter receptor subunit TctC
MRLRTALLRFIGALFALGWVMPLVLVPSALAQDYPSRPIRVLIGTSAGGISDIFMRALGDELQKQWGQPLIVENRAGGHFNIASKACADAPPDGYTVCVLPAEPLTYNQFLFKQIPYDPEKSFTPVSNLFFITQVMAVSASLNVKTLADLSAVSKAKPGTLSYAAPGLSHALFVENFKKETGADMVKVPFKGGGDAVNGLLTGTTPAIMLGLGNVISLIEAGKATALLVDSEKRTSQLPDVPTIAETGYNGDITRSYFGMVAPAGLPAAIVDKWANAMSKIVNEPAFRDRNLTKRGLESAVNGPAAFEEFLQKDRRAAERVVRASDLQPQ